MSIRSALGNTRFLACAAVAGAASAAFLAIPATAQAAPVTAEVSVASAITLTDLTPSFLLSGIPGDIATTAAPVTMTVTTNNAAGYSVTVASVDLTLVGALPGNTTSIPISALKVRETGTTGYSSISATALTVHTQATPSDELGDEVSNDFSMTIPFVAPDTYTATLNYIAATL